jgi:hypothetical protein
MSTARTAAALAVASAALLGTTLAPAAAAPVSPATVTSTRFSVDCASTSAMKASHYKNHSHATMVWSCGAKAPKGTKYAYVYPHTVAEWKIYDSHGKAYTVHLKAGWHRVILTHRYHVHSV